jgi:hypothetical protein
MASGFDLYNPATIPFSSHIAIKIGDTLYEGDTPNFLQSLNFTKMSEEQATFSFQISDVMDYELEAKLIKATSEISSFPVSLQYGHAQGAMSVWYRGFIQSYEPQFLPNFNMTFTVTGICDLLTSTPISRTYKIKDYGYRISNLIKAIAEEEKWSIGDPFITTDKMDKDMDLGRYNLTSLGFIRAVLLPQARKNNNTVRLLHSCTSKGVTVRLVEVALGKSKITKKSYNFVINSGNFGSVLEFSPSYQGITAMALKVNAGYVDRETNQFMLFTNKPDLGKASPTNTQIFGATSPESFQNIVQDKWFANNVGAVDATMQIVGDPDINPLDYINVMPFRPDGRLHHTAGTYLVLGVVDDIQGGMYKTSLTLTKIHGEGTAIISDTYDSGW